ncbi:MAG: hypothetical protein D6E12_00785 [Desulfovibrio sp.]|nr:MAG: hypothetical protein D6E12_00785 [Desulfovibrio sp.]
MFPSGRRIAKRLGLGTESGQRGASLLFFVVALVILGILASGMASMFRASVRNVSSPNYNKRSHYMAESGIRYALSELRESTDIIATVTRLNSGNYTVDDEDLFDLTVSTLGMLQAEQDIGPGVKIGNFGSDTGVPDDFCDLVPDKVADSPVAGDQLHLVFSGSVGKPNELDFNQVDACTYLGNGVIQFDLQNSMDIVEDDYVYMAAAFDDSPSMSIGTGDTIQVGWAARRFPPNHGALYAYDKGEKKQVEIFYDEIVCDDAAQDCWMTISLNQPEPADWPLNGLSSDTFFVLNSNNYGNYWITSTGYSGPDDTDTIISLNAIASNYLGGTSDPDETGDHAPYILSIGGGWPEDDERVGVEGESYEGVYTEDGTRLDDTNLADLDSGLTMENGATNAGSDSLNCVARYGQNNMQSVGNFYADFGDYEAAIKTGSSAVVSSCDFEYTSLETYSFYLSYNLDGLYEIFWEYGNLSTGYVSIADVADDPDHSAPIYVAPSGGADRYLGNFWIHAKGAVQNSQKYFRTRVTDLLIFFDGMAWPGEAWEANTAYESNATDLDYVVPTFDTWNATAAVAVDDLVYGTDPNGFIFRCTSAGTTSTTEPTWPTVEGDTVVDGSVTWEAERGLVYRCTTAGTSGAAEPAWPTSRGATVTDGTVEWTCGLPDFESGSAYTYLVTQQDNSTEKLEVIGDFQFVWNKMTSSDYGLQFYLQLHDVP